MLDAGVPYVPRCPKRPAQLKMAALERVRVYSKYNDLDPLRLSPEVDFTWVGPGQVISRRF